MDTKLITIKNITANGFKIGKIIKDKGLQIFEENKFLGYIPLDNYTSNRESQLLLLEKLIDIKGFKIFEDEYSNYYDCVIYNDSIRYFKPYCQTKSNYSLIHGSELATKNSDFYLDGRMENYHSSVMDYFQFDKEKILKQIDPNNLISVVTRKYKDWYVDYSLNIQEMKLFYRDDDFDYEPNDCDEDCLFFLVYKEDKELLNKVFEFLKKEKENLEILNYIAAELDYKNYYRINIIELDALELVFNKFELEESIKDRIEWNYENIAINFKKALIESLDENIEVSSDFKVIIEKNNIKTTYNQLQLLVKIGKIMGFGVIKSNIYNEDKNLTWAIQKDDELFHFQLLELIYFDLYDKENDFYKSVREFADIALMSIQKRKLEKIDKSELLKMASNIFVSFQDSLMSGNCNSGTKKFAEKHNIDLNKIGGIRGDILLNLESSDYVNRAIYYALTIQVKMKGN